MPVKKRREIFSPELFLARNHKIRDVLRFFAAHDKSSYKVIFDNKTIVALLHCSSPPFVTQHFCFFFSKACESLQNEGDMTSRERCQALLWEYQASAAIETDDVSNPCKKEKR